MTETTEAEHISILESIRAKVAYDHADYQTVQWALDKIKENEALTDKKNALEKLLDLAYIALHTAGESGVLTFKIRAELESEDVPPPVKVKP